MSDSSSSEEDLPPSKRLKSSGPTSFITWNANGLVSRCNWNKDELIKLLKETSNPDVLCLQEVRLKATSPTNRGTPLPSDYKSIQPIMETTVFADYDKYWSLANTKYAGTLTLLHKRLRFQPQNAAFCTQAAIDLLLSKYNLSRAETGLPTKNNTNSPQKKTKQSTLTAFFAPKSPLKNNGTKSTSSSEHQEEGRFQFFVFDGMDLINTYVPNNGTKEESFQRRRDWDQDMKRFVTQRKTILKKAGVQDRPLLWMGDFNCAREYRDGTHWEKIGEDNSNNSKKTSNSDEPNIYEWWRDESQCFVVGAAKKLEPNRSPGDMGIPSFTTNERRRFAELLQEGDFVDIWRTLYPNGVADDKGKYKTEWCRPNYTWRGHLSKDGNSYQSKYQGKGQRLDYFLLSPSSLVPDVVDACQILGFGERREGFYCGSDHCATILRFKKPL